MSTLNITAEELDNLVKMKDQGKISEAWNLLGSKGDAYAYLAGAIVADNTASMSPLTHLFYEMVRSQWENTGAGGGRCRKRNLKHVKPENPLEAGAAA